MFGSISSSPESHFSYEVDGNSTEHSSTVLNGHKILLYTRSGLGRGKHNFRASFDSTAVVDLSGEHCFEVDFLR